MHQKTKKSAFVGEALAEKGKIMQESSARESDVRFPGEESVTKAGLRRHRARHATAPLWRKTQSAIAPPERKARRENTLPMRKSGVRRILRRMSTVRKQTSRRRSTGAGKLSDEENAKSHPLRRGSTKLKHNLRNENAEYAKYSGE